MCCMCCTWCSALHGFASPNIQECTPIYGGSLVYIGCVPICWGTSTYGNASPYIWVPHHLGKHLDSLSVNAFPDIGFPQRMGIHPNTLCMLVYGDASPYNYKGTPTYGNASSLTVVPRYMGMHCQTLGGTFSYIGMHSYMLGS